ncbi:MAG: Nif3-like dinuclear metal center hexameric protein [Ignavibacteria bacterium]|nr:Nif3-like dinuclear metal center hexameric protein [Ignavibacteria bacterium]
MHGDAIGLQVASKRSDVGRVLVCLEITDAVVAEAIERSCDTILTFHPLIYTPLARLDRSDRVSRCVGDLIAADISVICVHTAFDAFPQGTNLILAERLGLEPLRPLVSLNRTDPPVWGSLHRAP